MTTFVLVHGAWSGGWIWRRVADRLRAHGHRVFTPTLTGLTDRSHLLSRNITLSTHILDITNLVKWEELDRFVLVGHSYGGMVITGVTEKVPPGAITAIVYIDAMLPENGKSLADYAPLRREPAPGFAIPPEADYLIPPIPATPPRMNPKDAPWMDRQRTWQPIATFTEPVHLTGALERIGSKTYVLATGFDNVNLRQFGERVKNDPAWHYIELPCGHDVQLAMPDETTAILEEAAKAGMPPR